MIRSASNWPFYGDGDNHLELDCSLMLRDACRNASRCNSNAAIETLIMYLNKPNSKCQYMHYIFKSSCCLDLITNNYSQKQHVLLIISSDWGHYKLSEEVEVTHKIDSLVIIKHLNEQIFRHWINSSRLFVCLFVFILFLFIF